MAVLDCLIGACDVHGLDSIWECHGQMRTIHSGSPTLLPEKINNFDVVVCGGGPAGLAAAIAAARNGASTLLIEQYAFLGGNAAMFLPVWPFHNRRGQQLIMGIPQEIIDRLAAIGGTNGHHMCSEHCSITVVDGEKLKYVAQEMCLEAGVQILFHSLVTDVVLEDGVLKSVAVANKSGRQIISGKVFIDATGDGDVAARAGVPYEKGRPEDGAMQPPTMMFRVGNVDMQAFMQAALATGKGESGHVNYDYREYLKGHQFVFFGRADIVQRAVAKGDLPLPWTFIFVTTPRIGEVAINMGKVPGTDATDVWSLTHAEIEGRRQMFQIVPFVQKYMPGFEKSYLINSAHQIGIRESRRIKGEYTLTVDDLVHNKAFPDSVALGGYPIDVHSPAGIGNLAFDDLTIEYGYHIPYRALVPLKVDNLLVAGRCISVEWVAFGSTRVMAICMAIGQAAGTAAAVCVRQKTTPRRVNVPQVQNALIKDKALISAAALHVYDEQRQGFFIVHTRLKELAADGKLLLTCALHNFTNQPASATMELKPLGNVAFDTPALTTGTIAPFSEQVFTLTGRQTDAAPRLEYGVRLQYANGPTVDKTLCHLLVPRGLTPGWDSGDWPAFAPGPEHFRSDPDTAPLHGARFNLSYDDRGLQLLLDVRDDFLGPSDGHKHKGLWNVDCVELFLDGRAANKVGNRPYQPGVCQVLLYPGTFGQSPAFYSLCSRPPIDRPFPMELSAEHSPAGYRLRALIPFASFCVEPGIPTKIGIDLAINTVNKLGWGIGKYTYAGGRDNWKNAVGFREVWLR